MSDEGFLEAVRNMRNHESNQERAGEYWSDDDKRRLKEMFARGIGISEIAIRLQRTEPAVYQQSEKMDLYNRKDNPKRRKTAANKNCSCHCPTCEVDPSLCHQHLEWKARGGILSDAGTI